MFIIYISGSDEHFQLEDPNCPTTIFKGPQKIYKYIKYKNKNI